MWTREGKPLAVDMEHFINVEGRADGRNIYARRSNRKIKSNQPI